MQKVMVLLIAGMLLNTTCVFAGNGDLLVNGNLGVGALSPTAPLTLDSSSGGAAKARFYYKGATYPSIYADIFHNGDASGLTLQSIGSTAGSGDISFWTGSLSPSEAMRINYLGNVGFKMRNPNEYVGIDGLGGSAALGVYYASSPYPKIRGFIAHGGNGSGINNEGGLQIAVQGANYSASGSGDIKFFTPLSYSVDGNIDSPLAVRMTILQNGNVGIGTANPLHKLVVNGDIYSNLILLTSDERYKKNILPVQDAVTTLLQLEGVSYEWKQPEEYINTTTTVSPVGHKPVEISGIPVDGISLKIKQPETRNFPQGRHYGVVAQAVEKVLPEVVKTDSNGYKAVDYVGIIPILIEAIKEQQKHIEALEKKIAAQ